MTKAEILGIVAAMMLLYDPGRNATAVRYIIRGMDDNHRGFIEQKGRRLIQRDSQGKRVGTLEYHTGDILIIRDSDGLRTGSAELGQGERVIVKDAGGVRIGAIEMDQSNRLIMRDLEGHSIGTIEGR